MNLYVRPEGPRRRIDGGDDALLTAIVEAVIAETVMRPAPEPPPDPALPASAENFLADAAAFLRTRPDAAELLHRLRAALGIVGDDTPAVATFTPRDAPVFVPPDGPAAVPPGDAGPAPAAIADGSPRAA